MMWMTENEIVSKYIRNGKNASQIAILADLNGVTKSDIIDVLEKHQVISKLHSKGLSSDTSEDSSDNLNSSNSQIKDDIDTTNTQSHSCKSKRKGAKKIEIDQATRDRIIALRNDRHSVYSISKDIGYSATVIKRVLVESGLDTSSKMKGEFYSTTMKSQNRVFNKILVKLEDRIATSSESQSQKLKDTKRILQDIFEELNAEGREKFEPAARERYMERLKSLSNTPSESAKKKKLD